MNLPLPLMVGIVMGSLFFRMYHRSTLVSDDHQNRQTTDGKTVRKTEKIKQKSDQARVLLPAAPLWHMHEIRKNTDGRS